MAATAVHWPVPVAAGRLCVPTHYHVTIVSFESHAALFQAMFQADQLLLVVAVAVAVAFYYSYLCFAV